MTFPFGDSIVDAIARAIAASGSRRTLLGALAGSLLGLSNLAVDADSTAEAAKPKRKRKRRKPCPKKRRCRKRCCRPGTRCRGGVCRRVRRPAPKPKPNPAPGPNPGPDPGPPRTRRSLHSLAVNGPEFEALAQGVAAMKQLPASDPRNWLNQANIHWDLCQHGSVHFLSWHRMYIYWFERILRQASGDDTLTVPYWNYSDPGQRVLPAPFRDPSNALYVAERNPEVNAGEEPNPSVFNMQGTMEQLTFMHYESGPSFGGSTSEGGGRLESAPHNPVHTWIGGLMGSVQTAARDPLFWLHHANIDRLWEVWLRLGEGRANTSDPAFLNKSFTFFNENAAAVTLTGSQILDTVGQLGYQYDDMPAGGGFSAQRRRSSLAPAKRTASKVVGATPASRSIVLRRTAARVTVPLAKGGGATISAARQSAASRITLTLNGVAGTGVHGVLFEVRVAANGGTGKNVGTLGLFGLQPDDHNPNRGGHNMGTVAFDITGAVPAGAKRVSVTLVPINVSGTGSLPDGALATIERMVISVQGAAATAGPRKKKQTPQQRKKARLAKKAKAKQQKPKQRQPKQRSSNQQQRPRPRPKIVNRKQKRSSANPRTPSANGAFAPDAATVPGNKSSAGNLFAAGGSDGSDPHSAHH